jgi:hypothetical protein
MRNIRFGFIIIATLAAPLFASVADAHGHERLVRALAPRQ